MKQNRARKKKKIWQIYFSAWGPVIVWMLVLFLLSGRSRLPGPEDEWGRLVFMKSAHMLMYAGLYFWLWRGWQLTALKRIWLFWDRKKWTEAEKSDYLAFNKANKSNLLWLILLGVCTLYGMSDEWHQSFIVGRTATWRDVGFDTLGATMGMAVLYWWF